MAKRILVVEDGADLRAVVVAMLTQVCGYETIEAANGREAVAKSVSEKPDLILMEALAAASMPELRKRAGVRVDGKQRRWR